MCQLSIAFCWKWVLRCTSSLGLRCSSRITYTTYRNENENLNLSLACAHPGSTTAKWKRRHEWLRRGSSPRPLQRCDALQKTRCRKEVSSSCVCVYAHRLLLRLVIRLYSSDLVHVMEKLHVLASGEERSDLWHNVYSRCFSNCWLKVWQTLGGPFSTVSKPLFVS